MLEFEPFSVDKPVEIYRTDLPHWRQEGATYFVTFRLGDSIPKGVVAGWMLDRAAWLKAHGIEMDEAGHWMDALRKLPLSDQSSFQKMFNRKLNEYLDAGYGSCVLAQRENAEIVGEKLMFFHGERCDVGDFVVMPNHVHVLMRPYDGHSLERILQSIKKESSRAINRAQGNTGGALWQKHSYDHLVRDTAELRAFRRYIAENPRKAGLSTDACLHREADYACLQ